ncbi:MAG: rhomboid family intramembrane serine protease [Phycisphaeraceae bacterium]|jgi:membrane associated rhomboid family serine protease|nr:rhomboid family intramembrane serine protease [Phycisphaeraceae bacterium]
MFFPYKVDVPLSRWPIENWLLIVATCIGAVVYLLSPVMHQNWAVLHRKESDFSLIQLLGHALAHGGIIHLVGNLFALFIFGNAVNSKFSSFYIPIYAFIAVGTGLAWLALGTGPTALGASGAVYGVMGAFLVFFPRNDISVFYVWAYFRAGTTEVSAHWVMLFYVASDIILISITNASGVGPIAHLAGFALGFSIALGTCALGLTPSQEYEHSLWDIIRSRGPGGQIIQKTKKSTTKNNPLANTPRSTQPTVSLRPPTPHVILDNEPIPLASDKPPPLPKPRSTPIIHKRPRPSNH